MPTDPVVPSAPAPGEDWSIDDPALDAVLALELPAALRDEAARRLRALGRAAPATLDALAREADRKRPVLRGSRPADVEYDASYEEIRRLAREHEVFTLAWRPLGAAARAPRVLGFALGYLFAQAECGYYCPACMTDGAALVLQRHAAPDVRDAFVPRLVQREAEGAFEGAMYLTEKRGGSDVGAATETRAERGEDGAWRLTGLKWFASNCTADAALAFARMPDGGAGTAGLGLFLVPRATPDGAPNPGLTIDRLKDKLGVTSMPTGEVRLDGAFAHLVAPGGGAGFRAMMEMVNLSRLYNAVASVALARRALREGQRAGRHREAFGKPLREQPLFARAVAALAVDVEGALALTLDAAVAFDAAAAGDERAARALRVLTPPAKAMTARLAVDAASQACEFLGGVGYTEEYVTPRLLRDAQVLPIWEGTTNVQGLEFLRVATRADTLEAFLARAKARLGEAPAAARPAADAAARALAALAAEAPRAREVAALRLLALAYHAHATACLARLASARLAPGRAARAARVANLYAARHLGSRAEGEAALEAAVEAGVGDIAWPGG